MRWHQCLYACISQILFTISVIAAIHTNFDGTKGDHGAVNFVDCIIDLLKIIRVGDDLIAGKDILQ
jgi:hypothetical protein